MKHFTVIASLILMLWLVGSVQAATYTQGAYEFETCGANCTTSGTYGVQDNGAQEFLVSTGATTDYVEFAVSGKHLVIFRFVGLGFTSMDVCINGGCTNVSNANAVSVVQPYVLALTGGTDTIRIVRNFVYLDYFLVLNDPGSAFPTPVPTATILPSSTPAPTATPINSPTPMDTPVNTPTPMDTPVDTPTPIASITPISVIWALDPASRYEMVNGQIVREAYALTAGDYVTIALLTIIAGIMIVIEGIHLWKR
jgi:hypothetical protein